MDMSLTEVLWWFNLPKYVETKIVNINIWKNIKLAQAKKNKCLVSGNVLIFSIVGR